MWQSPMDAFKTPQEGDLDLEYLVNGSSLSISILPNGAVFTIEHGPDRQRTMINQVLASSLAGGIGRLYVRVGEPTSEILRVTGPGVDRCGGGDDRFVWESVAAGLRHEVILWLHPDLNLWLWQIEVSNDVDVREFVYVDAHTGKIVDRLPGIYDALNRRAYDGQFLPVVPPLP